MFNVFYVILDMLLEVFFKCFQEFGFWWCFNWFEAKLFSSWNFPVWKLNSFGNCLSWLMVCFSHSSWNSLFHCFVCLPFVTELSKHIWELKRSGIQYQISWHIVSRARLYNSCTMKCDLFLTEKLIAKAGPFFPTWHLWWVQL